jgi:hypothetical protein
VADARDVFADLARGQLAAFAGFGALRHFDFEFLGVNEIVGGHAKPRRGNLFDFVGGSRLETIGVGIFAAFAGIAAAAQLIHSKRERSMRFWAERAERHRLRAEALEDGFERLDFGERNAGVQNGVQEIAEEDRTLAFRQFFKRGILLGIRRAHMSMKPPHDFRGVCVKLRALAEAVETRISEIIGFFREGFFVQA